MKVKHLLYTSILLLSFSTCYKSLENRVAQGCKEYTEKKCLTPVASDVGMDSVVSESSSRIIHYYYSLVGNADNGQAINAKKPELRKTLRDALKAGTGTRGYKGSSFDSRYTHRSNKPLSKMLLDEQYTEKDYQKPEERILEGVSEISYDSNLSIKED